MGTSAMVPQLGKFVYKCFYRNKILSALFGAFGAHKHGILFNRPFGVIAANLADCLSFYWLMHRLPCCFPYLELLDYYFKELRLYLENVLYCRSPIISPFCTTGRCLM